MNYVRQKRLDLLPMEALEDAAECLKVLGHPIRLRIVDILMQGEFAVYEIAELCELSHNQTCEHLRLLKSHHLLDSKRDGKTVYYAITAPELPGVLECIRNNCSRKLNLKVSGKKGNK
jgi:ArsR family transcriptional regulator, zinc-responsive transcriptional repressor